MCKTLGLSAVLLLLLVGVAGAQSVPMGINYQGVLKNANNEALPTGDYTLTFRVYAGAEGGNPLWEQVFGSGTLPKVAVVNGAFNVVLGPKQGAGQSEIDQWLGVFSDVPRYLEIKVGDANPLLPRQQILSAPYAIRAEHSAQADNADNATHAVRADNGVPVGTIAAVYAACDPEWEAKNDWLYCDGRPLSQFTDSKYAELAGLLRSTGKVSLPDLRGVFLRGLDSSGTVDPEGQNRALGTYQADGFQQHNHKHGHTVRLPNSLSLGGYVQVPYGGSHYADNALEALPADAPATSGRIQDETRPKNVTVNYIIKY